MYEFFLKLSTLMTTDVELHELFLQLCDLRTEDRERISGLSEEQRQVVEKALQAARAKLSRAFKTPLGNLGVRELDLLHFLSWGYTCAECNDGENDGGFCAKCVSCSQVQFYEVCNVAKSKFRVHALMHNHSPFLSAFARAEIFANRLSRGLHVIEAEWRDVDWEQVNNTMFDFGPEFSRWCVSIMFDGTRIGRACGSLDINGGDTTYDLYRVCVFSYALSRALRRNGFETESDCINMILDTPTSSRPLTVPKIRQLLHKVNTLSPNALHAAFSGDMFQRDGVHYSLFAAAQLYTKTHPTPLFGVAHVFGTAFLSLIGKGYSDSVSFINAYPAQRPPIQRTITANKMVNKSTSSARAAQGMLKAEGPYTPADDRLFGHALTLASVKSVLGSPSEANEELRLMTLAALGRYDSMSLAAIETTLFIKGPLFYFTQQGFYQMAKEWHSNDTEEERPTSLLARANTCAMTSVLTAAVTTAAKRLCVDTANYLDAYNVEVRHSAFVTRVLDILCMLGKHGVRLTRCLPLRS